MDDSDAILFAVLLICLVLVIVTYALGYSTGRTLCATTQKSEHTEGLNVV